LDAGAECEFRYQPDGWSKPYRFVGLRSEKPREEREAEGAEQYQLFEPSQYKYRVFVADMNAPIHFVVWFCGQRGVAVASLGDTIMLMKLGKTVDAMSIRELVAYYQRGVGADDDASRELRVRGEAARDELIRMLGATPAAKLRSAQTETILNILQFQFPSQASFEAVERLRSRAADPRVQEGLRDDAALLRAHVSGRQNEAWWVEHRKLSSSERRLHYEELLLESSDPPDRVFFLVKAARVALEIGNEAKAEAYAREILATPDLAAKCGEGVYYGNHVLGMLALKRGDVASAKRHLIESAKTPASWVPLYWPIPPQTFLAYELVGLGEREVVCEYLDLCKVFSKKDTMIESWKAAIRAGSTPEFYQDWLKANTAEARARKKRRDMSSNASPSRSDRAK